MKKQDGTSRTNVTRIAVLLALVFAATSPVSAGMIYQFVDPGIAGYQISGLIELNDGTPIPSTSVGSSEFNSFISNWNLTFTPTGSTSISFGSDTGSITYEPFGRSPSDVSFSIETSKISLLNGGSITFHDQADNYNYVIDSNSANYVLSDLQHETHGAATRATLGLANVTDSSSGIVMATASAVPEPASIALFGIGGICLLGMVAFRRKRECLDTAAL
jgi:PEP-CTERM motif